MFLMRKFHDTWKHAGRTHRISRGNTSFMHKAFVYVVFMGENLNCDAFRYGVRQVRQVQVRGRSGPDTLFLLQQSA